MIRDVRVEGFRFRVYVRISGLGFRISFLFWGVFPGHGREGGNTLHGDDIEITFPENQ